MEITTRDQDSVMVVDFSGNLDTNTAADAEAHFRNLIEQGATKILANFQNLEYISSAGLRVLLATAKKMKTSGGEFRLCNLNEMATEVFEMSGFSTILSVFKTESDALSGL